MTYFTRLSLLGTLLLGLESVEAKEINEAQGFNEKNDSVSREALEIAHKIYQVMEPYLLDRDLAAAAVGLGYNVEKISADNKQKLIRRLAIIVDAKRPIDLNLVAFPFKSGNRDHLVLGHLADMAEFKSLEYLNTMRQAIADIYPNVQFRIYTDGLLFNDLFEIPDEHVAAYEESLRQLGQSFPEIRIITFSEILAHKGVALQQVRENSDLHARSIKPPEHRVVLMERRILREIKHSRHSFSRLPQHQQSQRLKQLTKLIIGRVETARSMVKEHERPGSFNLSAHLQKDFDKRLGIMLFPKGAIPPSDAVLVEADDGSLILCNKQDVDMTKYRLVSQTINNLPCPYFSWR